MIDERNDAEEGWDEEARTQSNKHTADPDEEEHVGGKRKGDLTDGGEQGADAEGLAPADHGAGKAAGDHERAANQRIDHVGELNIRGRRPEVLRQRVRGERKRAVVAGGSHLGKNQDDDGQHEEFLFTRTRCGLSGGSGRRVRR